MEGMVWFILTTLAQSQSNRANQLQTVTSRNMNQKKPFFFIHLLAPVFCDSILCLFDWLVSCILLGHFSQWASPLKDGESMCLAHRYSLNAYSCAWWVSVHFTKDLFWIMCLCVHLCRHVCMCVQLLMGLRRGHGITWSWSHSLWVSQLLQNLPHW